MTAIEADRTLVAMASKFDEQLLWALEKEKQKKVGALLDLLHKSSPRALYFFSQSFLKANIEAFCSMAS